MECKVGLCSLTGLDRIRDEYVQVVVENSRKNERKNRNDAIVKKIDEMGVRGCKLGKENKGGKR